MKSLKTKWLLLTVALLFCFGQSYAQDEQEAHVIHVQTFNIGNVEGGSLAEFDSLVNLLTVNVTSKRAKILSRRMMNHLWGSDNRQFIIISEYASMDDLLAVTNENTSELFNAYWDTEEKRTAFGEAYGKYFANSYHSDEIYQEIPGGRK